MKAILGVISIVLALLISSCAQTGMKSLEERLVDDGFKRLTAAEITETLVGNTINAEVAGIKFYVYIKSDGTSKGKRIRSSGEVTELTGTWKVSTMEDVYCDQWDNFGSGSDCDQIFMKGEEIVILNLSGRESSRGVVEPGNSKGL